jgi:hypothetical protein
MRRSILLAAIMSSILGHLEDQNVLAGAAETSGNEPLGEKNYRATLVSPRQDYLLGENILIRYRLENTGNVPLHYEKGASYPTLRRNDGYRISAVLLDDKGQPSGEMAPAIPGPSHHGGPITDWELMPGKGYEQTLYLPRYLRVEKPGTYRIRIANVERMDPDKVLSAAEITLTLKMPTAKEARAIYERMKKLPDGPVAEIGEALDTEIADFEALHQPIYLPILAERAADKDVSAFLGLGKIHTAEATAALAKLIEPALSANDPDFALLVYRQLEDRLPNPRYYHHEKTDPNYHQSYAPQRAFLEKVWRPEFAKPLRQLASRLARDPDGNGLGVLSYIYECVGLPEDLPDLMRGYSQAIEATKTLPFETHQYFRPRGAAYDFQFSTPQLLARGAKIPTAPNTPGEAAVYFIALATRPEFRPADWPEQVVRWLKDDSPYLREFVLDHTPEPFPVAALDMLPQLMTHEYIDLQIAACHVARTHPRPANKVPLQTILLKGKEEHLLNAATKASPANGLTNDLILEIWLNRLGDNDLAGTAVSRFLRMILAADDCSSRRDLPEATRINFTARAKQFIETNREKLRDGHRFKIGDPEITEELVPMGFTFHHQGQLWPPGNNR